MSSARAFHSREQKFGHYMVSLRAQRAADSMASALVDAAARSGEIHNSRVGRAGAMSPHQTF
jgi:hypothetical protein